MPAKSELIAAAFATALCCTAFGLRLLEVFRIRGAPRIERIAAAFGLGVGVLSLTTLFAGVLGVTGSIVAASILSAFFVLGLGPLIRMASGFRKESSITSSTPDRRGAVEPAETPHVLPPSFELATDHPPSRGEKKTESTLENKRSVSPLFAFMFVVCVVLTVLYLVTAFLPALDYDDLEYHLGAPAEHVRSGRVCFIPWNVYAQFPQVAEMSYLHAMWLHGSVEAGAIHGKLLNLVAAVMTLLVTFSVARRWLSVELSLLAATLFYSAPLYGKLVWVNYVEILLTLYTILVVASLLRAYEGGAMCDRKWIALGGAFAGLAVGCKYTAAVLTVVPAVLMCLLAEAFVVRAQSKARELAGGLATNAARQSKIRTALTSSLVFGLLCVIVTSPWLVRNALWTGNPVYPFFYSLFGGKEWDALCDARFWQAHEPYARFRANLAMLAADPAGRAADARDIPDNRLEVLWIELRGAIAGTAELPPELPTSLFIPVPFALLHLFSKRPLSMLEEGAGAQRDGRLPAPGIMPQEVRSRRYGFICLFSFAALYFLCWAIFTHVVVRFLVPLLPVFGILSASDAQMTRVRWVRGTLVVVMLAISGVCVWQASDIYLRVVSYAHDDEMRQELLTATEETLPKAALQALEAEWKAVDKGGDAFVVFVGEARAFDCRFPCIAPTVFNRHPLENLFEGQPAAGEIEQRLERLFPHRHLAILVNHGELERLTRTYRFLFEGKEYPGVPPLWDKAKWTEVLHAGIWRRIYVSPRETIEVFVRRR